MGKTITKMTHEIVFELSWGNEREKYILKQNRTNKKNAVT